MALDNDSVLGTCYIPVSAFKVKARSFGCNVSTSLFGYTDLVAAVALASRLVDAYCGRQFDGATIYENHKFSMETRRIYPVNPPVVNLTTYSIQTAPGSYQTVLTTPVLTDAGSNNISYGAIVYSQQENYLELASLAVITAITPVLISLGITEPQVRIAYTSYGSVPAQVATATGLIAAAVCNESRANDLAPVGLNSISTEDQSVSRMTLPPSVGIPERAELLLRRYQTVYFT